MRAVLEGLMHSFVSAGSRGPRVHGPGVAENFVYRPEVFGEVITRGAIRLNGETSKLVAAMAGAPTIKMARQVCRQIVQVYGEVVAVGISCCREVRVAKVAASDRVALLAAGQVSGLLALRIKVSPFTSSIVVTKTGSRSETMLVKVACLEEVGLHTGRGIIFTTGYEGNGPLVKVVTAVGHCH